MMEPVFLKVIGGSFPSIKPSQLLRCVEVARFRRSPIDEPTHSIRKKRAEIPNQHLIQLSA